MINYVLGFMFSNDKTFVALIEKRKPVWQEGLLNGIGGKIEQYPTCEESDTYSKRKSPVYEKPVDAMVREFKEETGLETSPIEWKHFATMKGDNWSVRCFKAFSHNVFDVFTNEIETVRIINLKSLNGYKTISNVPWLIAMALDKDNFISEIKYL